MPMLRATWFVLLWLAVPAAASPAFVSAKGVFAIDDSGKVKRLLPDTQLPITMATDADGDLWVSSIAGKLTAFKNKTFSVQLPSNDTNNRYPIAMIAAKSGGVWALGREALFKISPNGKLEKLPIFVPRIRGPASILEVGDVLWVVSENGVHQLAAGKWTASRSGLHLHLALDSAGVVWSVARRKDKPDALVGWDGTKWTEVAIDGEGIAAIAPGKEGRLYALVWGKGPRNSRIDVLAGGKWTAKKLGGLDALRELLVDAGERVWTKQAFDLVVLAKDGTRIATLPPGTIPNLPGLVAELVVAGAGPTTLPTPGPVAKGSVTGRIMKTDKEPLANTKLVVCTGNCFDASPKFELITDADGKFEVDDVAAVEYASILTPNNTVHSIGNFLVKRARTTQLACCLQIVAGKTLDLGTLRAPSDP